MDAIRKMWNHRYCERFLRLCSLALVVGMPAYLWFALGWNASPALFLLFVIGLPVLALMVAIPAGWLNRANLRRSWGWLIGHWRGSSPGVRDHAAGSHPAGRGSARSPSPVCRMLISMDTPARARALSEPGVALANKVKDILRPGQSAASRQPGRTSATGCLRRRSTCPTVENPRVGRLVLCFGSRTARRCSGVAAAAELVARLVPAAARAATPCHRRGSGASGRRWSGRRAARGRRAEPGGTRPMVAPCSRSLRTW